jgi:hypothetical protein
MAHTGAKGVLAPPSCNVEKYQNKPRNDQEDIPNELAFRYAIANVKSNIKGNAKEGKIERYLVFQGKSRC